MVQTIFYSWQSDLPNSSNRGFIEAALNKAVRNIRSDDSIKLDPVIERDTQGIPGSPDIAKTIFNKISKSQAFVADISIINSEGTSRRTPNPNVLVELGYAMGQLGSERIIMVQNLAYGTPEMLPFDLRLKRVLTYNMLSTNNSKAYERKHLASMLETALRLILDSKQAHSLSDKSVLAWFDVLEFLRRGLIRTKYLDDAIAEAVVNKMGRYRLSVSREDELSDLKNEFVELYKIYSEMGDFN